MIGKERSTVMPRPSPTPPPDPIHASEITDLQGRVVGHAMDETSGGLHMILEGNDQKIHLIPHDKRIESAHRSGRLAPKTVIRLGCRAETITIVPGEKSERTRGRAR